MTGILVPRHRTDKNGRVVKRWVKEEIEVKPSRIPPAPVLQVPDREYFSKRLGKAMAMSIGPSDIKRISDESLLLLDGMLETIIKSPDDRACLSAWIGPYSYYEDGQDEEIKLVAAYQRMEEGTQLSDTLRYTRGLYAYEDRFSHSQNQALIDVSVAVTEVILLDLKDINAGATYQSFFDGDHQGKRRGDYWIRDEAFIDLVTSRTEDVPAIISLVKERGILDAQAIEEILDAGSHSVLLEGSL